MESDLSNLYSNAVRPKGRVGLTGGGSFGVSFERDSKLAQLEQSVFSQIHEYTKAPTETIPSPKIKTSDLRIVSVEDAIRELQMIEASGVEHPPIF